MKINNSQRWYHSVLLTAIIALSFQPVKADIIISEFLASSTGASILDQDNEPSDWIEIRNTGNSTVSLLGYKLTDDATDLALWTFPNVSIPANGYLIVFASSKNLTPTNGELHTNFKLSSGGEYLALVNPAGTVIDSYDPDFPNQFEDISYGISTDQTTNGYFTTPTPGNTNTTPTDLLVEDTVFSVNRGIFSAPFSLAITSATQGATIKYTTNGSTPTLSNGSTYSSPISITGTTVIRAAAFKTGLNPTNVDTQTYLFPSDIRTQNANGSAPAGWPSSSVNGQVYDYGMDPDITGRYTAQEMEDALTAIPSVMITTDQANITDASTGIYSNPGEHGSLWERPSNIEFIGAGLPDNISSRCGLRIRGGASRNANNPKHSFRTFYDADYGDSRLLYPIFGTEGVDNFKKLDFRTAQNYSWSKDGNASSNTFLRDVLGRDLQAASGQPYTRSRYYHLYLNGIYWGLFMSQERAEANWGASYLGGDDNDFDTLKSQGSSGGYDTEATDGNFETTPTGADSAWKQLWDLARAQQASPTTNRYNRMQGLTNAGAPSTTRPTLLDVDNLIDYMMVLGYTGAFDNSLSDFVGASNNWYSVRNSLIDNRGFVHLMHDGEHSLGAGGGRWNNNNDRINTDNGVSDANRANFDMSNPQFLHMDLAESTAEYRLRFADRAHAALFNEGYLTKEKVLELFEKRRQVVDQVIIAESARWGDAQRDDPADKENWESAVDSLESIFDTRTEVFLGHLRQGNLYPDTDAPVFLPFASLVNVGDTIAVSATEGTVYYTTDGSDPRQSNGSPSATAIDLSDTTTSPIFPQNSTWAFDDSGTDRGSSLIVSGHGSYNSSNWKHPDFNTSGWSNGAGILGFGNLGQTTFATITTSMGFESTPSNSNPLTSYLRRHFNIVDTSAIGALQATLLLDDSAVIYINGKEVYRQNITDGEVTSTTLASQAVNNDPEKTYSTIILDASALVNGDNVIAVEVHQVNNGSSDLGFDLSLSEVSSQEIMITEPTYLSARTLNNGEWSALNTQYYSTGVIPQIGDLVISEIHYHPANPTTAAELAISADSSDFEFIELANISSKTLELQGSTLAEQVISDHLEGVKFIFEDGFILQPGERVCIVANEDAFFARYPFTPTTSVAGEYQGKLGNSGEWIELRNIEDTILASFRYNDVSPWPEDADGSGPSLQLSNLYSGIDYTDPNSWIAITNDGSPASSSTGAFTGPTDIDADGDGSVALIEYFAGSSDLSAASNHTPELFQDTDEVDSTVRYSYIRDPEALNLNWGFQQTTDFQTWTTPSPAGTLIERVVRPDGLLFETYEFDTSATAVRPKVFIRQNIQLGE